MPTNRSRRTRKVAKTPLLDFVRILLSEGPEVEHQAVMAEITNPGEIRLTGKVEAFRMRGGGPDINGKYRLKEAWDLHKDEILKIWKAERREGLPWAAKEFD